MKGNRGELHAPKEEPGIERDENLNGESNLYFKELCSTLCVPHVMENFVTEGKQVFSCPSHGSEASPPFLTLQDGRVP